MDSLRIWRRANAQSSFAWNCMSYCLGSSLALVCVSCWAQETAPTVVPVAPVAAPQADSADSPVSPSDTTGTASEESTTSVKQPTDKQHGHDDGGKHHQGGPEGPRHFLADGRME